MKQKKSIILLIIIVMTLFNNLKTIEAKKFEINNKTPNTLIINHDSQSINNNKSTVTLLANKSTATCSSECNDIAPAVRIVKYGIIPLFQIAIPILLIVMGMLDFTKAVMAKEEEMKKIQSAFIKRCIYAIAIFLVVTIVTLVFNLLGESGITASEVEGQSDWLTCYATVDKCTN